MLEQKKQILAQIISGVLHPLLLPVYLAAAILFLPEQLSLMHPQLKWRAMSIVAYSFVILPVSILYVLAKWGKISSMHLNARKDRFIPMFLIAISYIIGLRLLHVIDAPSTLILFMRGVCLAIIIVALISTFWKISAHMTGIGGALGIVVLLSIIHKTDLSGIAIAITLFAGTIGWARLYLKCHNNNQVYYGFLVGFSTMIISFLLHALL